MAAEGTPLAAEHRTASRVMAILEAAVASEPKGLGLGDLAVALDAPKSSVHGLVKGLVALGYLRMQEGRYFTGPALHSLLGGSQPGLPAAFRHALENLNAQWGETCFIATLVGDSMVYLDEVESSRSIRAAVVLNSRMPLWPRSSGKCFLAFMEPRRRDAVLRRLGTSERAAGRIRKELDDIVANSVALNLGETEPDQTGVAAPIRLAPGSVTYAIALAGPSERLRPHLDGIVESVRAAADQLSIEGLR